MFTGIVKGRGRIAAVEDRENFRSITVSLPADCCHGIETGASIALDGVCLTVTGFTSTSASFDIIHETLRRSTLGELGVGAEVNIERSAREGVEIGGHPLSGHVDCICHIAALEPQENNLTITFAVPPPYIAYIFSKGYVALNGCSLTACDVDKKAGTFKVWLIPETLRLTTFGDKKVGAAINLEIERTTQVIVDTVTQFLTDNLGPLVQQLKEGKLEQLLPQLQRLLGP